VEKASLESDFIKRVVVANSGAMSGVLMLLMAQTAILVAQLVLYPSTCHQQCLLQGQQSMT